MWLVWFVGLFRWFRNFYLGLLPYKTISEFNDTQKLDRQIIIYDNNVLIILHVIQTRMVDTDQSKVCKGCVGWQLWCWWQMDGGRDIKKIIQGSVKQINCAVLTVHSAVMSYDTNKKLKYVTTAHPFVQTVLCSLLYN